MPQHLRTKPRKRASQARSRALVAAVLEGAARVLLRDGYDKASTNRIALAAGVSVGSLYQYFPSKEAIVAALIERHMHQALAAVEADLEAVAEAPPEIAVPKLILMFFTMRKVSPKLRRVFIEQVPRVGAFAVWATLEARATALVTAYLMRHRPKLPRPELTAHVIVRAVAAATYSEAPFAEAALVAELTTFVLARLC